MNKICVTCWGSDLKRWCHLVLGFRNKDEVLRTCIQIIYYELTTCNQSLEVIWGTLQIPYSICIWCLIMQHNSMYEQNRRVAHLQLSVTLRKWNKYSSEQIYYQILYYTSNINIHNHKSFPDWSPAKISLVCWVTRMKVVRFGSSLSLPAPVYVHADRKPPRMSIMVVFTSPLYGISTDFPSLALWERKTKIMYCYMNFSYILYPMTLNCICRSS